MEEQAHIEWTGIQGYLELWKNDQLEKLKPSHPDIEITITLKEKDKNIKTGEETEEGPIIKCPGIIETRYVNHTLPAKRLSTSFLNEEENSQRVTCVRTTKEKRQQTVIFWGVQLSGHVVVLFSEPVGPYKAKKNTFSLKRNKAKRHEISVVDIFSAIEHLLDKAPEWEKKRESIVFNHPVEALKKWSRTSEIKNEMTFFSTAELPDIITPYTSSGSSGHSPGRIGNSTVSEGVSSLDRSDTLETLTEQLQELGFALEAPMLALERKSPEKKMTKTDPASRTFPNSRIKNVPTLLTVPYEKPKLSKKSFWNSPKKGERKSMLLGAPEFREHKSLEKSNEKGSLAKSNSPIFPNKFSQKKDSPQERSSYEASGENTQSFGK